MNTLVIYKQQVFELNCSFTFKLGEEILHQMEWTSVHNPSADLQIWILQFRHFQPAQREYTGWSLQTLMTLRSDNEVPRTLSFSLKPKSNSGDESVQVSIIVVHMDRNQLRVWHNG